MNSLLLDIVLFLVSKQVVQGDGQDIFRDFIPEEPDAVVSLIEYKGTGGPLVDEAVNRSIQVTVRDKQADLARAKALEIYSALEQAQDGAGKITFTSIRWGQVSLHQTPFKYKTDQNNRSYYCFNMSITTTTH